MKQIPNLFTLLNLVFGCLAIIFILKYEPDSGMNLSGISLLIGCLFIFCSAIIDFLDGFVARLFKATSEMGAQLDSLADVVSFGVAPGMILFKMIEAIVLHSQVFNADQSFWYALPALIVPCASAWRLAKFNLDKEQTYYFKGLPTPAAGLCIASLPLMRLGNFSILESNWALYILYAVIVIISWLMVSNMPLISLKFKGFGWKQNIDKIILAVVALAAVIFLQWAAVPVILVVYIFLSLIFKPAKV